MVAVACMRPAFEFYVTDTKAPHCYLRVFSWVQRHASHQNSSVTLLRMLAYHMVAYARMHSTFIDVWILALKYLPAAGQAWCCLSSL